jgi:hypothetical protein
LDFAEGLGFAEGGLVEGFVEFGHEEAGGGVVDFPEGCEDGFGSALVAEEVGSDACDF